MNKTIFATAVATIFSITSASAQTCGTAPTCESLGYIRVASNCNGSHISCPFDATKVACLNNAPQIGDLKYSLYSSNHAGWLKCDGTQYSSTTYSRLYSAITTNFCHKYTSKTDTAYGTNNCKSGFFAVPDYRGFFLRVAGSYNAPSNTVGASNYYFSDALNFKGGSNHSSVYYPQYEQLPNIKGDGPNLDDYARDWVGISGAFYEGGSSGYDANSSHSGNQTRLMFDASKSNAIYAGTNVIPANYGVYVYIYAGQ